MASHEYYAGDIAALSTDLFMEQPHRLRETLEAHDSLRFASYQSGLFPASDLPHTLGTQTGMNMAWLRDNAHVAMALYKDGQSQKAGNAGSAMLQILHNNRDILDDSDNFDGPGTFQRRLPVRVVGDTLQNDTEFRTQNDSVGYSLWLTSRLIMDGALKPTQNDLDVLAQTVRYLERVRYWQDNDEGHWEEDSRIHASSIGAAMAGIRDCQKMFEQVGYGHNINIRRLLDNGSEALYAILSQGITDISGPALARLRARNTQTWPEQIHPDNCVMGSFLSFDIHKRRQDAALLFLIEPLDVLKNSWADKIVNDVETYLVRDRGIVRYAGDTYWSPGFKELLTIEERTRSAEGRLDLRNATAAKVADTRTEAQWTLFDPILSNYWGKRYQETGDPEHHRKQLLHLNRSLSQLMPQPDGSRKLPELYYYEHDGLMDDSFTVVPQLRLTPGDHMPLLWSQANLLGALNTFERTATIRSN